MLPSRGGDGSHRRGASGAMEQYAVHSRRVDVDYKLHVVWSAIALESEFRGASLWFHAFGGTLHARPMWSLWMVAQRGTTQGPSDASKYVMCVSLANSSARRK